MAKSLKQLYAQWNRVFHYFTCADFDMTAMAYRNTHSRIIDYANDAMRSYSDNVNKYFGGVTNEQYAQPLSRDIYAKRK